MTKIFVSIAIFTASLVELTNAQTPFPIGVTVGISKPGLNAAAKNYTIYTTTTPASGNYMQGVTFTADHDLNGIGLDSVDNFVYASSYTGENNTSNLVNGVSLYRIGADGANINLGYLPTTGQTSVEFPSFSAGTVSNDDAYYYLSFGLKASGVAKLFMASASHPLNLDTSDVRVFLCWINNISGLSANANAPLSGGLGGYYEITFSHHHLRDAMQAFLGQVNAQYPNVYNADGGIQDIAINPIDKKIYGYFSYPLNSSTMLGRSFRLDFPVNNKVAALPVGNTINFNPNREMDGAAFDETGNLYTLFTTGGYANIDLSSGEVNNLTPGNFATAGGNLRGDLGSASGTAYQTNPLADGLVDFEGKNNGNYNTLNWTTVSENNNTGFIVERSSDLKQWNNIGIVNSNAPDGNSNTTLNYSFNDASPLTGLNYYRLYQIHKDGKGFYSGIIFINHSGNESAVVLFPNPAKQYFNIAGLQEGQLITVTNIEGKVVLKTKATSFQITINASQLSSGIYQVMVTDSNGKMSPAQKIQVNR